MKCKPGLHPPERQSGKEELDIQSAVKSVLVGVTCQVVCQCSRL